MWHSAMLISPSEDLNRLAWAKSSASTDRLLLVAKLAYLESAGVSLHGTELCSVDLP